MLRRIDPYGEQFIDPDAERWPKYFFNDARDDETVEVLSRWRDGFRHPRNSWGGAWDGRLSTVESFLTGRGHSADVIRDMGVEKIYQEIMDYAAKSGPVNTTTPTTSWPADFDSRSKAPPAGSDKFLSVANVVEQFEEWLPTRYRVTQFCAKHGVRVHSWNTSDGRPHTGIDPAQLREAMTADNELDYPPVAKGEITKESTEQVAKNIWDDKKGELLGEAGAAGAGAARKILVDDTGSKEAATRKKRMAKIAREKRESNSKYYSVNDLKLPSEVRKECLGLEITAFTDISEEGLKDLGLRKSSVVVILARIEANDRGLEHP